MYHFKGAMGIPTMCHRTRKSMVTRKSRLWDGLCTQRWTALISSFHIFLFTFLFLLFGRGRGYSRSKPTWKQAYFFRCWIFHFDILELKRGSAQVSMFPIFGLLLVHTLRWSGHRVLAHICLVIKLPFSQLSKKLTQNPGKLLNYAPLVRGGGLFRFVYVSWSCSCC